MGTTTKYLVHIEEMAADKKHFTDSLRKKGAGQNPETYI
jgi:hypothetical protein